MWDFCGKLTDFFVSTLPLPRSVTSPVFQAHSYTNAQSM
jgi:hypothetical protein